MSLLASNTLANPLNSFYALAGTGPASSLQSPVDIIPDGAGDAEIVVEASTGSGDATVRISSTNGNNALLVIENTAGGNSTIEMGVAPPGTGGIFLGTDGTGVLAIANAGDSIAQMAIDTVNAAVTIGSTNAASAAPNSSLALVTPGSNGDATIILDGGATDAIHFSDPTTIGIALYQNTNTHPGELSIGNDTAGTTVASFNQLTNISNIGNPLNAGAIYLNNTTTVTNSGSRPPVGGIVLQQTSASNANISQQVASGTGSLTLGSSVTNPTSLFINDTGGGADTAVVDITRGTGTGIALRLQGYGASTAATVSTNLGTGGGGILNLTSGYNDPVLTPAIQILDTEITVNRQMTLKGSPAPLASWTGPGAPAGTPSVILKPAGVSSGSFTVSLAGLQTGWSMVYGGVSPGSTPLINDKAAFFAVMVYTDTGDVIRGGGVGGVAGLVTCQPADPAATELGVNIAAPTSANYVIYGMTLWGG